MSHVCKLVDSQGVAVLAIDELGVVLLNVVKVLAENFSPYVVL